jgi:hypothetical protein
MRSGSISIANDGFEVAGELFGEPFAAGGLRFGMKSAGDGMKFGGFKAVSALRSAEQETSEVCDFRSLLCGQSLAKFDQFHRFRAHIADVSRKVTLGNAAGRSQFKSEDKMMNAKWRRSAEH